MEHVSAQAVYQLAMGGFLFGAVFMVTDPVTGPSTPPARIMFGLLVGGITFYLLKLRKYLYVIVSIG